MTGWAIAAMLLLTGCSALVIFGGSYAYKRGWFRYG